MNKSRIYVCTDVLVRYARRNTKRVDTIILSVPCTLRTWIITIRIQPRFTLEKTFVTAYSLLFKIITSFRKTGLIRNKIFKWLSYYLIGKFTSAYWMIRFVNPQSLARLLGHPFKQKMSKFITIDYDLHFKHNYKTTKHPKVTIWHELVIKQLHTNAEAHRWL